MTGDRRMTGDRPESLETATLAAFSGRIGERFSVSGTEIALTLSEAKQLGQSERPGGSFALVFEGPEDLHLEQAIYRLECANARPMDLFLVPIGPFGQGMGFEAVFT